MQVLSSVALLLLCYQAPPASSYHSQQQCGKWEANCRKHGLYCKDSEPSSPHAVIWSGCCKLENVSGASSGIYTLSGLAGHFSTTQAYCDVTNEDKVWTLIHKRTNGSLSFDKTWRDFEDGFGNLEEEFWFGLKAMSLMTTTGQWKLRVDMEVSEEEGDEPELISVEYNHFQVGGPEENYQLNASEFNKSTTYDILKDFQGNPFSTYDRDNDGGTSSCATLKRGGWWYPLYCSSNKGLNINKEYEGGGIMWQQSIVKTVQVKSIEMKIRPSTCITDV